VSEDILYNVAELLICFLLKTNYMLLNRKNKITPLIFGRPTFTANGLRLKEVGDFEAQTFF
jgi:hypothetical protein